MKTTYNLHALKNSSSNLNYICGWAITNFTQIIEYTKAEMEIEKASLDSSTLAYDIYRFYISVIVTVTGVKPNHRDNPLDYVHFIRSAKFVRKHKLDYELFIKTQFKAFEYNWGIPNFQSLYGEKSLQRYYKYKNTVKHVKDKKRETVKI
jgi:hypothetical protein